MGAQRENALGRNLSLAVSIFRRDNHENHLGAALIKPVDYVIVLNEWFTQLGWNRGKLMLSSLFLLKEERGLFLLERLWELPFWLAEGICKRERDKEDGGVFAVSRSI